MPGPGGAESYTAYPTTQDVANKDEYLAYCKKKKDERKNMNHDNYDEDVYMTRLGLYFKVFETDKLKCTAEVHSAEKWKFYSLKISSIINGISNMICKKNQ